MQNNINMEALGAAGAQEVCVMAFGEGAFGEFAIGEGSFQLPTEPQAQINVASIIVSGGKTAHGTLVKATAAVWRDIVARLGADWSVALQYTSRQWEEIIAGTFKRLGFDEVTLTPRSGDHCRDVIAVSAGFFSQKVIVSMKANAPGKLVSYDDVRALLGVMSGERDVTKGMLTTTSDFPPNIRKDPFIAPFLPTRLELVNGDGLLLLLRNLQPSANS